MSIAPLWLNIYHTETGLSVLVNLVFSLWARYFSISLRWVRRNSTARGLNTSVFHARPSYTNRGSTKANNVTSCYRIIHHITIIKINHGHLLCLNVLLRPLHSCTFRSSGAHPYISLLSVASPLSHKNLITHRGCYVVQAENRITEALSRSLGDRRCHLCTRVRKKKALLRLLKSLVFYAEEALYTS